MDARPFELTNDDIADLICACQARFVALDKLLALTTDAEDRARLTERRQRTKILLNRLAVL